MKDRIGFDNITAYINHLDPIEESFILIPKSMETHQIGKKRRKNLQRQTAWKHVFNIIVVVVNVDVSYWIGKVVHAKWFTFVARVASKRFGSFTKRTVRTINDSIPYFIDYVERFRPFISYYFLLLRFLNISNWY